jgi:hypothetical protein
MRTKTLAVVPRVAVVLPMTAVPAPRATSRATSHKGHKGHRRHDEVRLFPDRGRQGTVRGRSAGQPPRPREDLERERLAVLGSQVTVLK